jgi:hypothetical protein
VEPRKAGRRDWFALRLCLGQFEIQPQHESQGVFGVFHAIGRTDGGVEGGLGVAEAVGASGFEGTIEVAQGPAFGGHDLATRGPQGTGGFGNSANLL